MRFNHNSSGRFLLSVLIISIFTSFVGCKDGEDQPAGDANASTPAANSISLMGNDTAKAPVEGKSEDAPLPAPPAIDFASAQRPVGEGGAQLSDLDLLNRSLENFVERRATTEIVVQGNFQSEAEEVAATEKAAREAQAPVTDLNQLVQAGVIKAIPAAPAGKKYVIDTATMKVVLVNQ